MPSQSYLQDTCNNQALAVPGSSNRHGRHLLGVRDSLRSSSFALGRNSLHGYRNSVTRLFPGDVAPDFTLPDADGKPVSLSSYRGKRTIVYFYPAAMTPGCTTQACDFRDSLSALNAAGVSVLGVSPDPPEQLAKFRERDGLTFPLLADEDKSVLLAYGAYGEKKLYGKLVEGVIRSTFVIAPDGTIEKAMYNVKATGHVAKLRRDLGID